MTNAKILNTDTKIHTVLLILTSIFAVLIPACMMILSMVLGIFV